MQNKTYFEIHQDDNVDEAESSDIILVGRSRDAKLYGILVKDLLPGEGVDLSIFQYSSTFSYSIGEPAIINNKWFISKTDNNIGKNPENNPLDWEPSSQVTVTALIDYVTGVYNNKNAAVVEGGIIYRLKTSVQLPFVSSSAPSSDTTNWEVVGGVSENQSVGFPWVYDGTNSNDSDPGSGNFKMNNIDPVQVTSFYISNINSLSTDVSSVIQNLQVGSKIAPQQLNDTAKNALYEVSGPVVDNGVYKTIPVVYLSSPPSVSFIDAELFSLFFIPVDGTISGKDVREKIYFDPDLNNVVVTTYDMPSTLTEIPGNGILQISYRACLNDGNFNYISYASLTEVNTFFASNVDGTKIQLERTVVAGWPDSILVINNLE